MGFGLRAEYSVELGAEGFGFGSPVDLEAGNAHTSGRIEVFGAQGVGFRGLGV